MRTNGRHVRGVIPPVNGKTFAALPFIAGVILGAIAAFTLAVMPANAVARTSLATATIRCTLDGGGSIAAGEVAHTDTGTWACTEDRTLVRALTWHHLTHLCHARTVPCTRVPVAVRRELALGGRPALLVIGATSWIYVRAGTWGLALYES
jgi:hypothetical protein